MTILVSSTEPKALHTLGKLSMAPEKHGVDFFWRANDQSWGIQRKEIKDLLASVDDGRLAKELQQSRTLTQCVLVVEGKLKFTPSGELILGNRGTKNRWTKTNLMALFLSVQMKGWWILFTGNVIETGEAIIGIKKWSGKDSHASLDGRPAMKAIMWGKGSDREYACWVLQSAPGVGPEVAKKIFDALGPVVALTATDEQLLSVPGVGPKLVEKLRSAFSG